MKPKSLRFIIFFSLFCLSFLILQSLIVNRYSSVNASVPQQMTYQGKVTDVDGVGITDTLDIVFSLWNDEFSGIKLWEETQTNVSIIKGLFDVQLGSVNPINLPFDSTYYLQIKVDGDSLSPRTQLTTSPYAFRAEYADSIPGGVNLDTIWSLDKDPADTIVIMAQTKIHGELITDSIQAVGDNIEIDDNLDIYGCATLYEYLTEILCTEGFESGDPPVGWEETDRVGDANLSYTTSSAYPDGYNPTEGTKMVRFNSYDCETADEITLRQNVGFATTGYHDITVNFDMLHDSEYGLLNDRVQLIYSRDSLTWTLAGVVSRYDGSVGWKTESIALPDSLSDRPVIFIALRFISDWGNNIHLDSLVVTGRNSAVRVPSVSICDGDIQVDGNVEVGNSITASGDIEATRFILNGATLDAWHWERSGNYLYLNNLSDSVCIGGNNPRDRLDIKGSMTIRGDNSNLPHGTALASNKESVRFAGQESDYIISLQDGSGRIQHYWNSTTSTPSENKYLVGGEPAWMWNLNINDNPYMEFKFALSGSRGDTIDWITHMVFDTDGNIGIGYEDNILAKLAVNGAVGIGTKNPYDPLHVQAFDSTDGMDDGVFISVRNTCNLDSAYSGIRFKNHSDDDDQFYKAGIVYQRTQSWGRGSLFFLNDGQSNASNADFSDARMAITYEGDVGIGVVDPPRKFWVNGGAGGTTAWYNDSDIRLKKNIIDIPNPLERVQQLRGVQFEWKDTENHAEGKHIGFIAQEVLPILPEVVDKPDEYYGMQYSPITAILVEAIKEQQKQIEELRQRIAELENK